MSEIPLKIDAKKLPGCVNCRAPAARSDSRIYHAPDRAAVSRKGKPLIILESEPVLT